MFGDLTTPWWAPIEGFLEVEGNLREKEVESSQMDLLGQGMEHHQEDLKKRYGKIYLSMGKE